MFAASPPFWGCLLSHPLYKLSFATYLVLAIHFHFHRISLVHCPLFVLVRSARKLEIDVFVLMRFIKLHCLCFHVRLLLAHILALITGRSITVGPLSELSVCAHVRYVRLYLQQYVLHTIL